MLNFKISREFKVSKYRIECGPLQFSWQKEHEALRTGFDSFLLYFLSDLINWTVSFSDGWGIGIYSFFAACFQCAICLSSSRNWSLVCMRVHNVSVMPQKNRICSILLLLLRLMWTEITIAWFVDFSYILLIDFRAAVNGISLWAYEGG